MNLQNAVLAALQEPAGDTAAGASHIGNQLGLQHTGHTPGAATFTALDVGGAHLDAVRLAQDGSSTDGSGNPSGIAAGEDAPGRAWGEFFGGHANQANGSVPGYSAAYGGLVAGADATLGDWIAGGMFQFSASSLDATGDDAGDHTNVSAYGLMGYGAYTANPWYLNLSGGVVLQQYTTARHLTSVPGITANANGSFDGQQYVVRAEFGYPQAVSNTATVTPLASLTASYLNQDHYTETGGAIALAVDASHNTSVKSTLGFKFDDRIKTSQGVLVPDLKLVWAHEYDENPQLIQARFAADPTGQTAFDSYGQTPVQDLAELSAGVTVLRSDTLSLSVHYDLQTSHGFTSQGGIVRVEKQF